MRKYAEYKLTFGNLNIFKVFVSGNGEVTALEVLKDEQGSNQHPQNQQTSSIIELKHTLSDRTTQVSSPLGDHLPSPFTH